MSGRNIFIYGHRGVGKTSLALTAANEFASKLQNVKIVCVSCDKNMSFGQIIKDIADATLQEDPRVTKQSSAAKGSIGLSKLGLSANGEVNSMKELGTFSEPKSVNDASDIIRHISSRYKELIIIVDEFDQILDKEISYMFSVLVKRIADSKISAKMIICGIGESVEDLFQAHGSAQRYFDTERLELLKIGPLREIIDTACDGIGIKFDETTAYRIAMISSGSPYYVHLISEKLFNEIYYSTRDYKGNASAFFREGVNRAIEAISPLLKGNYEKAVKKYNDVYEELLWALADHHQLQRPTEEIYKSYQRIMAKRPNKEQLERKKFSQRMNYLKRETHGRMLKGTRQGWYEFKENIYRGYSRLRAEQEGIELGSEHPLESRF